MSSKFELELQETENLSLKIVGQYLLSREDIRQNLEKENKSLDECWDYIVGQAKEQAINGCAFMNDETVFGLAVHYYDEDGLEVKKPSGVAVSTSVQQTGQTVAAKKPKSKPKPVAEGQVSLF